MGHEAWHLCRFNFDRSDIPCFLDILDRLALNRHKCHAPAFAKLWIGAGERGDLNIGCTG